MANPSTVEAIEAAALQLLPTARLKLTRALVDSLAHLSEQEIGQLWLEEAERRDLELESGRVAGIPGSEVVERIRARFR